MSDEVLAIEAVGLEKRFRVRGRVPGRPRATIEALRGATLRVPRATIHGVMGPNGSGKSTLLRVLATLITPEAGTATVMGCDVQRQSRQVRRAIGFSAGDERSLYWRLNARQNLEFAAALHGLRDVNDAIDRALGLVELLADRDRPVSGFSQGMARRLGLARALLHQPALLLLDEPTRSLDPLAREEFHAVIVRLRDEGVTTLLTTHDAAEAVDVCNGVSVLRRGAFVDGLGPLDGPSLEALVQEAAR